MAFKNAVFAALLAVLSRVFGSKGGCVEGSEANFVYSVIEELGGGKIRGGKMIN